MPRSLAVLVACLLVSAVSAAEPNVIEGFFLVAIDEVKLPATEAGMLMSIEVEEGDTVEDKQLIARIDDREAKMARNVAAYEYNAAKKQADNEVSIEAAVASEAVSKAEWDTAVEANRKVPGSFNATDVRRLELTWKKSGLQIELAKYEREVAIATAKAKHAQWLQADAMVGRRELTSPYPGIIVEKLRHKGEWVAPGDAVAHVVRMDQLRLPVRFKASEYYYRDMEGRAVDVIVHMAGGKTQTVSSQIGFASPVVELDNTFRAWVNVPNQRDGKGWLMGPGMPADLKLR